MLLLLTFCLLLHCGSLAFRAFYRIFATGLMNSIIKRARMLASIYHMT